MPQYKAVADIGTNSFHLIVAEINSSGQINTVQREKIIVRLGTEGEGVLKHISEKEKEKSIEVLTAFKKLADYYHAELYAVATSAVRESDNKDEFLDAVHKSCGIRIDVIDGKTEASYIYLGVQNALPATGKKILCLDIGGGSTEIIIGQNKEHNFVQSFKLGAVRLSKMFFPDFITTTEAIKKCSDYIKKILNGTALDKFQKGYDIAVGASGTIQAIAAVIAAKKYKSVPQDMNNFLFTSDELSSTAEIILKYTTMEERSRINGMEPARADIIPAGILILKNIFSILGINEMTISTFALREGYLINILNKNQKNQGQSDIVRNGQK